MKDKKDNAALEKEFLEFVSSAPVSPPAYLYENIKETVSQDLNPAILIIISKLAGIQTVCATVTLFFCPQFEIGFVKHDYLATLFQHSDGFGFMIVCGIIFLGGGAVIASLLINQAELKAIEKSVLIYFPIVALLAIILFYSVGGVNVWSLALPWFLGGALGSVIGFEVVKYFRFGANKQRV